MCGGGGGSPKKPTPAVAMPNPNAVADTSNDARARSAVVAATTQPPATFGAELGTGATPTGGQ